MRVVETVAGFGRGNRRVLARQHQVVQRALGARELATGGEGAGDVAGVAVELATGIDQHQVAGMNRRHVGAVVQHAGVGAGRHDRAVRGVLRTAEPELVQQFGIEVVLAYILAVTQHAGAELHRADVGARADLRGTSHHVLLVRILDEPHFVEGAAEVSLFFRAQRAKSHASAYRLQPAVDTRFESLVRRERIPDGRFVFEQPGQLGVEIRD